MNVTSLIEDAKKQQAKKPKAPEASGVKVLEEAYDAGDLALKRSAEEEEKEEKKPEQEKVLERMKARIVKEQTAMREMEKGPQREQKEKMVNSMKKRYNELLKQQGKEPYYSLPEGAMLMETSAFEEAIAKGIYNDDPGPLLALANEHLDHMILEYFLTFPNPHDFEVHELAEACGMTAEALEKEIYRLFAQCLRRGAF